MLKGTNLVGGDCFFKNWAARALTGPVSGSDYQFVTTSDIDYLLSKGANCFRLICSWEALQPTPNAVVPGTGNFGAYFTKFKALADYATSKGATVILDIHGGDAAVEGGAYYGVKIPGSYNGTAVSAALANVWFRLASIFKDNPRVGYGLMNEPNGISGAAWFQAAQGCINAIRSAGAKGLITAPGTAWDGASTWVSSGNAALFSGLKDPENNLAAQVHMYLDANAGGGANDIVSATIGVERLKPAVEAARAGGYRIFLGEIGFSASNTLAPAAWKALTEYMRANADVLVGWTWWAYGPPAWWGNYPFALCPRVAGAVDSPQMDLIEAELARSEAPAVPTVDVAALQAELAAVKQELADVKADLAHEEELGVQSLQENERLHSIIEAAEIALGAA